MKAFIGMMLTGKHFINQGIYCISILIRTSIIGVYFDFNPFINIEMGISSNHLKINLAIHLSLSCLDNMSIEPIREFSLELNLQTKSRLNV